MVLLSDLQDMLRVYRTVITTHALQVYYSAQVTSSQCRLVDVTSTLSSDSLPRLKSQRKEHQNSSVMIFEGSSGPVTSLAFSPDGLKIVSGSKDGTLRLWDIQTGQELIKMNCQTVAVPCVAFSPQGSQIASGSEEGTVQLWSVQTGRELGKLEGHAQAVTHVAFSLDGLLIASSSKDSDICVWRTETGRQLSRLVGHSTTVISATFSPDGLQIVSGSEDDTLRLWSVCTGQELAKFDNLMDSCLKTLIGPVQNGIQIALICPTGYPADAIITFLWDSQSGYDMVVTESHFSGVIESATFSPDGGLYAAKSDGGYTVRICNVQTGHDLGRLEGHTKSVLSIAFSPDGSQIASGSHDHTIRLWSTWMIHESAERESDLHLVKWVEFSPNGMYIIIGLEYQRTRLFKAHTGQELAKLENGPNDEVSSIAFSPNGLHIACGFRLWSNRVQTSYSIVQLWNVHTGQKSATLEGHVDHVLSVVFSPNSLRFRARKTRPCDSGTYRQGVNWPNLKATLMKCAQWHFH
jgi:WD40 repeat protein